MGALREQYIEDDKGKRLGVIIPIDEYNKMIDKLEELEDIRLYDEAKANNDVAEPFDEYLAKRKKSDD